jgi:hypothetical protein
LKKYLDLLIFGVNIGVMDNTTQLLINIAFGLVAFFGGWLVKLLFGQIAT